MEMPDLHNIDNEELLILSSLDSIVRRASVFLALDAIAERIEQRLCGDTTASMEWEAVPLDLYGTPLPETIRSSWVFILRAGAATGAERHPNSRQRMMSYRGSGDLQTGFDPEWRSN